MNGAVDDLKEVSFKNFLHWYSDGNLDLCKRTSYDSPQALKHIYLQLQKHSTQNSCYRIESTVCGHHVYKATWSRYIGEELPVQRKVNNIHDNFAVAVLKNSSTCTTGNFQKSAGTFYTRLAAR